MFFSQKKRAAVHGFRVDAGVQKRLLELVRSVGTKFTGGVAGANSLSFDPVEGGGGTMIAYCVTKDSATKTESPVGASETFLFGTIALVHAPMCACVCARALHPDSGSRPLRAHRLGRP